MESLLQGGYDLHVHAGPSSVKRKYSALEALKMAETAKMAGILLLDHGVPTTSLASLVNQFGYSAQAFGAIMLNPSVGGLNPAAVESAISMNAKMIQMPTYSAFGHIEKYGIDTKIFPHLLSEKTEGVMVTDQEGQIIPIVKEILKLIAEHDVMLATGHISVKETVALVGCAKSLGVKKILVCSVSTDVVDMPIDLQKSIRQDGVFFEHTFMALSSMPHRSTDIEFMVKSIMEVGPESCVLSTDSGQPSNPDLLASFEEFIKLLLQHGLKEAEIRTMMTTNPEILLGLR